MYDSKKDTLNHILKVKKYLKIIISNLAERIEEHDRSKLMEPEKAVFDEYTPKMAETVFDSDEYKDFLKKMKPALDHHYAENRHHPEHYENGIKDMTLVDLCEMIADWKASTLRNNNGDIYKSIEISQKRFGYSDELKQILINTAALFEAENLNNQDENKIK